MRERFMRFMQGRYGTDQFSQCLLVIALILILLSSFVSETVGGIFYIVGWAAAIYAYFRVFSKNIPKRYAENQAFLTKTSRIRNYFANQKNLAQQRKIYRIYKCPGCKQKIRVPKGKGRIEIRCPKCSTTFIKKS